MQWTHACVYQRVYTLMHLPLNVPPRALAHVSACTKSCLGVCICVYFCLMKVKGTHSCIRVLALMKNINDNALCISINVQNGK